VGYIAYCVLVVFVVGRLMRKVCVLSDYRIVVGLPVTRLDVGWSINKLVWVGYRLQKMVSIRRNSVPA